jgi:uncharacterized ion transporter superfamily protein YfcC
VLLGLLVVVAACATWVIPAGQYQRVRRDGREVVDPASYHAVASRPAGAGEVLLAFPRGLAATAPIVFYIFLIGGAFSVVNATGSIEAGIHRVVTLARGKSGLVLALLLVLFSLGGATIGMAEETLPFLPALVVLARRLGYDEVIGGAIGLVGAGAGFSGAFLNPFTVGVGQAIAGLPLFSGMGYRLVVWTVVTAITVVYVVAAARRHRLPGVPAEETDPATDGGRVSVRQGLVLAGIGLALALVVVGAMRWSWGLLELSGLFLGLAVFAGIAGRLGADGTAEAFIRGATDLAGAALVVGLARGVLVIFDGARVTDSILHALASVVASLPAWASIAGIYGVQILLSYLVPSGSGQAALSLPILTPLADLAGVTRQTGVLAYQFGDGFSNVFTPTQGYFMAGLALIGVSWTRWVRFLWPLQCIWLGTGLVLLLVAHAIGWGPF